MILLRDLSGKILKKENEITLTDLIKFSEPLIVENLGFKILPFRNFMDRVKEILSLFDPVLIYSKFLKEDKEIDPPKFTEGSIRDNFYFGENYLINVPQLKKLLKGLENPPDTILNSSFKYPLILISLLKNGKIFKIEESLYEVKGENLKDSHFEYAYNGLNAHKILEEQLNYYLKTKGAYIPYEFLKDYEINGKYPLMASVIIPVKNREKTIKDAILSGLSQKTKFKFNVIVIDNHSSDKTGEIVENLRKKYKNLYHLIPEEKHLNIGGCWQYGIEFKMCGKYAIQLDSDDVYADENVLQKIVEKFEERKCGMVVGSYKVVDFDLNPIIKDLISHKEWSRENGHNNLLRVNGIGAPRGYVTEILRNEFKFPDVGYGEDYAVSLGISGKYRVERIFENLYLCRRWGKNTDSNIDENKLFRYDEYKDFLRKIEIERRIKRNKEGR